MVLTGFLLWIGMSVLIVAVGNAIFRFSFFQEETKQVSDIKFAVVIAISEIVMISFVLTNRVLGIFGYFGIFLPAIEDGILSGLLVSMGSNFVYELYKAINNYKELLAAETETEKTISKEIKRVKK